MNAPKPGARISPSSTVTCRRCGKTGLAWAKSSKTGRSYLCETMPSMSETLDLRVVKPWEPHDCEKYRATVAEFETRCREDEAKREFAARLAALREDRRAGKLTVDEYVAAVGALAEEYE